MSIGKCAKIATTDSIELKSLFLSWFRCGDHFEVSFDSIGQKNFFDFSPKFFCVGFRKLQNAIKSEPRTRSTSNRCRCCFFSIAVLMVSLSFRFTTKITNVYKIITTRSIEPKIVSCSLVRSMHRYGIGFKSFP